MSTAMRIGILFNATQDAALLIKGARRIYPGACLVAVVSPRAAFPDDVSVDEVLRVELSPIRLLFSGGLFQLIRQLRAQQFDLFIVRFPTLKLRLLSASVKSRACEIWQSNGTIFPAQKEVCATVREYFAWRAHGTTTLMRLWRKACLSLVRNEQHRQK